MSACAVVHTYMIMKETLNECWGWQCQTTSCGNFSQHRVHCDLWNYTRTHLLKLPESVLLYPVKAVVFDLAKG